MAEPNYTSGDQGGIKITTMPQPTDAAGAYGVPGAVMNYGATGKVGNFGDLGVMVDIPVPGTDRTVKVNRAAAPAFTGFLNELSGLGYSLGDVEGFSARQKRGGSGPSEHGYGTAIDINPADNPFQSDKTNLPANIHDIAAKYGLVWGGDWTSPKDTMHFQWGGSSPWLTAAAQNTPPADFQSSLFGKAPAASAPEPTPAPAATSNSGDFKSGLFGAPATTPAATPSPATTETPAPSPAPAAPAADVTIPSAGPLTTPPQPSWWERNIAAPVRSMYNPTTGEPMNYLLQQPLLQSVGAGIVQGARNVGQTLNKWEQYWDQNPTLAAIDRDYGPAVDRAVGNVANFVFPGSVNPPASETPTDLAARGQRLAAETAANRTQYGTSLPFAGGEVAGNLLTTYPLAALGWAARGASAALPALRGALGVADVAGTSAGQNILTTPGQDWRTAGAEGAAGGLAVHGVLGSVANQFTRGAVGQAVQDARNLGFNLTTGEAAGGIAKNIEDVTQYLPGSGAAAKAAEHRAVINDILNRNMGMSGPTLNQATMQTARSRAGQLMDQVRSVTVDANRDPQLLTQLGDIAHEAGQQPQTGTSITNMIDVIQNTAANNGGKLPGDVMHDLIKQGTPLDRLVNSRDPVIKDFAQRIQAALQDSVSRTGDPAIYGAQQAAANQQAVNAFNQGRYFWKTIKTVEPLVDKTGSVDDASYAGLARRIEGTPLNPNFDPRFPGNNNEMATLARVLRGPLAELKSSGTGRQLITGRLLGLGGEAGVGGLGAATHIFAPQNFGTYLQDVVAPTLAAIGGGRILRYGPGMGFSAVEAARRNFNPLAARVLGPGVATNPLLSDQQQQTPQ